MPRCQTQCTVHPFLCLSPLQVSEIKPEWLVEIAPHYYSKRDILDDGKKLPKGKGKAAIDVTADA